jgi:hypothetical protein
MGALRDVFKRKLVEQQDAAHEAAKRWEPAEVERTGTQAEFEPKLRAIVLEVFESMREVKWPTAHVLTEGFPHDPTGVTAYALSRFGHGLLRSVSAEVVIDSNGKIAFDHPVTTVGEGPDETVVSCYPLDAPYEQLLASVQLTDRPEGRTLTLDSAGEVIYTRSTGMDRYDHLIYVSEALAEYLTTRAAHTVAGT